MSKQYPFNEEEIRAIASLKRAFKKADKLGLKFCGMDQALYVANERVLHEVKQNPRDVKAPYCPVAEAVRLNFSGADHLISGKPYQDSGGW